MNLDKNNIVGFPYVPGLVCGSLRYDIETIHADGIVVIPYHDLDHLNKGWAGIIVIDGAPFSHSMIRILGFGVPTLIVSASNAMRLKDGMQVLLDADNGVILRDVALTGQTTKPEMVKTPRSGKPVMSSDGVAVRLRASVRDVSGVYEALQHDAESIGLVRSEFLIPANGEQPDKTFYIGAFREIAEAAQPLAVTVRLLDLAADKRPAWISDIDGLNSPLGLQGPRLFHVAQVKDVFKAQLEALDRLSDQYEFRLLIPFLVRREEVSYWVDEIRSHMQKSISIGAMVETPAGALDAANWFDLIDFVSIGCNDLMQCLFAADRDQPALRNYLDPYAPLLYRFMRQVADSTKSHLDSVQLCGILPQLQSVLPILLGLGFRTFSVEPRLIRHLARIIETTSIKEAMQLASIVCESKETHEVRRILDLPKDNQQPFK